jgi:hypothetical protein
MQLPRAAIAASLCTAGCVILPQSLEPPPNDQTTVVLLTGTLDVPMDDVARHPWFAATAAPRPCPSPTRPKPCSYYEHGWY